jgi:hypothetical protein
MITDKKLLLVICSGLLFASISLAQNELTSTDSASVIHFTPENETTTEFADPNIFPVSETKFFGDHAIDSNAISYDKLRIVGGTLDVFGTVMGTITVIGGDAILHDSAVINGEIVAIGGKVHKKQGVTINGKVYETNLKEGLVYRETSGDTEIQGDTYFDTDHRRYSYYGSWIHPDFDLFDYNRHEGFVLTPINFYRSDYLNSSVRVNMTLGYRFGQKQPHGRLTFEKLFFPQDQLVLFGSVFRESRTDDYYRLPKEENGLAALVGRQDFYDRWDEEGWSFGIGVDLKHVKIKLRYADITQSSFDILDIWSVFHRDRRLRSNIIDFDTDLEYTELTVAYRTRTYHPFSTGFALMLNTEWFESGDMLNEDVNIEKTVSRTTSLAVLNWEFSDGVLLRSRLLGGTSNNLMLTPHRLFGVGGLGSVSAHSFKHQVGEEILQINVELIFTPHLWDDEWILKLFADAGHAWLKTQHGFGSIIENRDEFLSAVGIGIGKGDHNDWGWGFNIAKPTDGRDIIETTFRLNLNF